MLANARPRNSAFTPLADPFRRALRALTFKILVMLVVSMGLGLTKGAETNLSIVSAGDGTFSLTTLNGVNVWQNTGTSSYLYFKRPTNAFAFTAGQTLYARVTYYDDQGGGRISLQYDSQTSAYTTSAIHERTSRVGSGRFVDAYFELTSALLSKRQNSGADLRLICGTPGGVPISVSRVVLSNVPFDNADFLLAISRPWSSRYTGPARDEVDPTSLKGKVMAGYQGWFRTPNDIADNGWWHWIDGQTMEPQFYHVDMWPDLTQYDPASLVRAGNILTASGAPAYLFSSTSYSVVHQHFRWMRKHNIDGAWLQRFKWEAGTEPEWVLRNVSQAAAEEGRVWGLEYDVSGKNSATLVTELQADLQWLTTQFDIFNDPRYVRENGKPAIFIWGLPFPDRNISVQVADAAVDWLKAQNLYVIGGIPNTWASLGEGWQNHIAKYDGVLVWMSQSSTSGARTAEVNTFRDRGQDYYPHVWPGFSWAHLQDNTNTAYTARNGGKFYWDKGRRWVSAGVDRMFIGMFDEYDESTAIMPMTDDPPNPHTDYGRFINNEGKPSDWWMILTDELKRMLLNQRANTSTLPTVESLSNRSNIGPQAMVDLGMVDEENLLAWTDDLDGRTVVETVGGKECRSNLDPAIDRYMYFSVNNQFAHQLSNGDVTIEVEYFDSFNGSGSGTVLGLQYDGSGIIDLPEYTSHPQSITTTDSNTWRTVRFEISDAYFGGRQNMQADFRLRLNGKKLHVNRVWVRLPEAKAHPFTWTNDSAGASIDWAPNANWLGGIVAQPDPTSTVRFFTDQTMSGGTVSISNNISGQVFNRFELDGNASPSANTTVTLTGESLNLDGNTPEIALHANHGAYDISYDLQLPLVLSTQTLLSGEGDADFHLSGTISGDGGLIKTGASTLTLSGANTFSGGVVIQGGTLRISQAVQANNANPGNDASTVSIAQTGATLDLTYQGTDKVDKLIIGTAQMADGVYGKSGSTAPVIGIPQITGDGTLNVRGLARFSSWIAGNFAKGAVAMRGPQDDDDKDGIPNLIEYALAGLDPTVPDTVPKTITNGVFSFAKRTDAAGLSYAIEESIDLGANDAWREVSGTSYVNGPEAISYTPTPSAADKTFVRLKITMDPE